MKKFIYFIMSLLFLFLVISCGNNNEVNNSSKSPSIQQKNLESDKFILPKGFFLVEKSEYMPYLIDAIQRKDEEYLNQLILEQKVHYVEKDVKVSRFGYSSDPNNELIVFNEGKFTNKTGVTLKIFLLTEEQYNEREKKLYEESKDLIIKCLNETDNYENIISSTDYNYVKNFEKLCHNNAIILEKKFYNDNTKKEIYDMVIKAHEIISERCSAIFFYLKVLEYYKKYEQTTSNSIDKNVYKNLIKDYENKYNEFIQKEKQLRQEFFNKYGF